jgi:hypothetical protein
MGTASHSGCTIKGTSAHGEEHINPSSMGKSPFEQTLVENAKVTELGKERYPVRRTPKRGLRQVDFIFDGNEMLALGQNPDTKSRWAQLARAGRKVMQFLSEGR